jgi:hypothetical protein
MPENGLAETKIDTEEPHPTRKKLAYKECKNKITDFFSKL